VEKKVPIFVALLMFLAIGLGIASSEYKEFVTLEGKLSLSGSEPLVKIMFSPEGKGPYTVSGPYAEELKHLSGARVKITGGLENSKFPGTKGNIDVIDYELKDPGVSEEIDWAWGLLQKTQKGMVLIGEDSVIYQLTNYQDLGFEKINNAKVILMGQITKPENYQALIKVESYKVLKENAID